MTDVASDYGYRDGSGVHQVLRRLEERAAKDLALAEQLESLRRKVSSVKS